MYAILDIETTGGGFNQEKITEIAIYRFDGESIVDKFISMVNPEKPIEDFVVKLTGITTKMLKNAPKFYQIAKRVIEITQGCILVAHNAKFDYRVLKNEFKNLGFQYKRDTICTVELSKKLIPEAPAYNLEKLVKSLGIPLANRHRAFGDAMATVELFKVLLCKDVEKKIIGEEVKKNNCEAEKKHQIKTIERMPNDVGVYYVYDKDKELIYIGRAKSIRKKVNKHLMGRSKTDVLIQQNLGEIVFELTGTEVISQIKELEEVRKSSLIKKIKKLPKLKYCIEEEEDQWRYMTLKIGKIEDTSLCVMKFETEIQAISTLEKMVEKYQLCLKKVGLSQSKTQCSRHIEGNCKGACVEKENPEDYNKRVREAIEEFTFGDKTMAIIDKGREKDEKSVLFIEKGNFIGYGYVKLNHQIKASILKKIVTEVSKTSLIRSVVEKYYRNVSQRASKNIIILQENV